MATKKTMKTGYPSLFWTTAQMYANSPTFLFWSDNLHEILNGNAQ